MASHYELLLLSKVIETGGMKTMMHEGIRYEMFRTDDGRLLYNYLIDYFQGKKTRNSVPTLDMVLNQYPTLDLPDPPEHMTIEALCQEVRDEWVRGRVEEINDKIKDMYEDDPRGAVQCMYQDAKSIAAGSEVGDDEILADSSGDILREYYQAKDQLGYLGIPYPMGWGYHTKSGKPKVSKKTGQQFHPLNEQTRGMLNTEFILLYGRPKSLKTWLLMDVAVECYLHHNCRVLVFTKEMAPQQLRTRFVARMIGVDYQAFRNGKLSAEDEATLVDTVQHLKEEETRIFKQKNRNRSVLFTSGWGNSSASGLMELRAKIEEFEPDIVCADSVYLIQAVKKGSGVMYQDKGEIAYGLKEIAREYKIPLLATSQANRLGEETKGSTMAEIAYSDAFAQACDLALRVIKTESDDGDTLLSVIISGAREIKMAGFELVAVPAVKFQMTQIFESHRQVLARFRAEEIAQAKEEERAFKQRGRQLSLEKEKEDERSEEAD